MGCISVTEIQRLFMMTLQGIWHQESEVAGNFESWRDFVRCAEVSGLLACSLGRQGLGPLPDCNSIL